MRRETWNDARRAGMKTRAPAGGPGGPGAGTVAKLHANLAALRVLDRCRSEPRWATPEERAVLARWSG